MDTKEADQAQATRRAATIPGVAWLPPGSTVEVWLGDEPVPIELCTSSFALPFDDECRLVLANVRKRGADIAGGHVEPGEDAETTARREAVEETGAVIRILGKVGHLKLIVPDPPEGYRYPTPVSYQPFYAALVEEFGDVQMPDECAAPLRIPAIDAVAEPKFAMHAAFILAAEKMARPYLADAPRSDGPAAP